MSKRNPSHNSLRPWNKLSTQPVETTRRTSVTSSFYPTVFVYLAGTFPVKANPRIPIHGPRKTGVGNRIALHSAHPETERSEVGYLQRKLSRLEAKQHASCEAIFSDAVRQHLLKAQVEELSGRLESLANEVLLQMDKMSRPPFVPWSD